LAAGSREEVDRRWQAAVDAGFEAAGEPDARPEFGPDGYGGALRDPDGNSAAIVHHAQVRLDGDIDHLWLRVADPDVSRAFYDTIAAPAGLERVEQVPGAYVQYVEADTGRGGLRLLAGEPATQPLHFAFIANGPEPVHAFHAAAVAAGYEDNGAPGERPQYHPGYYAAFVLDPDGHNVEVVFQGQP
jgi:predicted lactoylglutathione lyase